MKPEELRVNAINQYRNDQQFIHSYQIASLSEESWHRGALRPNPSAM